jgi:ribosome-associated protein
MTNLNTLSTTDAARLVVDVAAENLAGDIVMLDLRGLTGFADYFVVMTAQSVRQIEALEEDLAKAMKEAAVAVHHREGTPASGWVLLDFADVVIHIFGPEEREFFNLERLWNRAPQVVRIL